MVGSRVGRSGMIGLGLWVLGNTFVPHISNIARVGIGNTVGDNLGAAIRKGNTVFTSSGVSVPFLILAKAGSRVIISNSILIAIDSRGIIGWLFVAMDWLVNNRGRMVDRGSMHHWLVDHWGRVIDRGGMDNRLVDNWGWVVDWCSMHNGLVNHWGGVIDWGWVVRSRVSIYWLVNRNMSWSMNSCTILLSGIGVVHVLGSGMGLLSHNCSI